jgi:hypothetical protein
MSLQKIKGVRCSQHLHSSGLPLNSVECEFVRIFFIDHIVLKINKIESRGSKGVRNVCFMVAMTAAHSIPYRHGQTSDITTRQVGADSTRSARLYADAGSTCRDTDYHGPYLTGAGRYLAAQLHQPWQHSSRPPASDPPQTQRLRRPRSHHRRGGQPGHPGHTRTLVSGDEVDEVVMSKPEQGMYCHTPVSGDDPGLTPRELCVEYVSDNLCKFGVYTTSSGVEFGKS